MRVMIMAGASGSGKSSHIGNNLLEGEGTRVLKITDLNVDDSMFDFYAGDQVVLSADDITFDDDGTFHIGRLDAAHKLCLNTFAKILQMEEKERPPDLIVDNTNTSPWELAPYVALALAHEDVVLEILVMTTPWKECLARCRHATPPKNIRTQARRLERMLDEWPAFWPAPRFL